MTLTEIRTKIASASEYKVLENYSTWLDIDLMDDDDEDDGHVRYEYDELGNVVSSSKKNKKPLTRKERKLKRRMKVDRKTSGPITWDEWDIKSALDYDMFFLPAQGNANWSKHGYVSL